MATTANAPTACTDASGNVISVEFSGTSDCNDLRIEVYDAATGDLLLTGPVSHDGANWNVSYSIAASDFALGDIVCDAMLQVTLKCRDTTPSQTEFSDPLRLICVDCTECAIAIGAVDGVPDSGGGLQSLTITGTAESCALVHVTVATSSAAAVEKDVPVVNGQWQAVFVQGEAAVGTRLKAYICQDVASIDVSCVDGEFECSASDSKPIACFTLPEPRDCPETADVVVTGPNNFERTNPTDDELECLPAGTYTLKCTTTAPAYIWRSDDILVTGQNNALQVVSVSGDTMVVTLTAGDNHHFSVTADISNGCKPLRTVAVHCGGSIDCVVSDWSDWSACIDDRQTRTRTVLIEPSNGGQPCPPLVEERDCSASVAVDCAVSAFSAWSNCVNGQQSRTRTVVTQPANGGRACPNLTETRPCTDIIVNLCLLWMFINLGLIVVTGILIFIAFCAIGADTWAAIAALASGGTLAAVFATLTGVVIALLIAAAIFAVVTLISMILWIIICLFFSLRDIMCGVINFILFVLHILMAISAVIAIVMLVIAALAAGSTLGCFVGATIDVAWFGIFEQIFFWIGVFTGCIRPFEIFGFAAPARRTG